MKPHFTLYNRALEIAVVHHSGQLEKNGEPYALHPIRLALALTTEAEKITALLHDVIEDTVVTLVELHDEGFSPEVLEAVALLTKPKGADYEAYIAKIAANPLARAVKMADLSDNMDTRRLPGPLTEKDHARLEKYHLAYTYLNVIAPTRHAL